MSSSIRRRNYRPRVTLLLALTLTAGVLVTAHRRVFPSKFHSSAVMQKSYELRCRGGGLRFNSTPGTTVVTGEQMMNMTVDFVAGTRGAAPVTNLSPGQCSWVDRGFRQGEPTRIRLEMVYFAQQQQARHGSGVDRSPTAAERYPDAQNVPQYLTSSDRYWSFWVYNTNNGYLQATSQKYFKPLKTLPGDKVRVPPPIRSGPTNVNES